MADAHTKTEYPAGPEEKRALEHFRTHKWEWFSELIGCVSWTERLKMVRKLSQKGEEGAKRAVLLAYFQKMKKEPPVDAVAILKERFPGAMSSIVQSTDRNEKLGILRDIWNGNCEHCKSFDLHPAVTEAYRMVNDGRL